MIAFLLTIVVSAPPRIAVEVDGEGYLRFSREGQMLFAKRAELTIAGGRLAHVQGPLLAPSLSVPATTANLSIDLEGRVVADGRPVGRIVLASLSSPRTEGDFIAGTAASIGNPGEGLFGVIRSGAKAGARGANGVTIRLRPSTEIETDSIRLGDVADILAPADVANRIASVDLGRTPPIGVPRGLDRVRVVARLRAEGLAPEKWEIDVPTGATVVRKANRILPDQIAEAALSFARERLGESVPIETKSLGTSWTLPPGKVEIVGETLAQSSTTVTVGLAARIDGKIVGRRSVVLGFSQTAVSFRVGAIVKVRVRSGAAVVETMGRVKQGGFLGQDIVVETREGTVLTGRGVSAGLVEVKS